MGDEEKGKKKDAAQLVLEQKDTVHLQKSGVPATDDSPKFECINLSNCEICAIFDMDVFFLSF